jgi:hypothetical protein
MSLLALFALCSTTFQGATPPVTPPDRSGESALRQILTWAKSLDNVHIAINKLTREKDGAPMYPDTRVDIWLSGAKFRLETSGYWGDGSAVTSDGVSVLSDSMNESDPAILAEAKGRPLPTLIELKVALDEMSPLFAFMAGPEQLEKLVEKTAAIKLEPELEGEKRISFQNKKLGGVILYYHEVKRGIMLDRIDFDNKVWLEEQYKKYPEWWDPPQPGALTRNDIAISFEKPSGSLFGIKPPKGRKFEDKRKKKGTMQD